MNELYKEVREIINFELDKAEEARTHKYCKNLRIIGGVLTALIIVAGIFGIYCVYADIHWGFYAFLAFTLLSVVLFKVYQTKNITRLTRLSNDNCCVITPLTAYVVMLQYSRRAKNCDAVLQCIGSMLFYMGKFEECKAVAGLLEKNSDTIVGKSYRYSLLAMVALIEKDRETVKTCIAEIETLVSQTPVQYVREAFRIISKYPEILEAEESGDYAKMMELLELDDAKSFTLKKVSTNYRLYKVAIVAGLEEEAAKHLAYVIEKGGDTFYKKELESC
jgi:hypothetical protein